MLTLYLPCKGWGVLRRLDIWLSLPLRLNSRDYLRDRSAASWSNPDNVSSLRIEPSSNAYGTESGPAGVTVTVIDHNPTLEVTKPVRSFVRDA